MDITHNLVIKATAERVYKAVATENGIKGWWSKNCTVGETVGTTSHLKFDKQGTLVEMGFKTLDLQPNKVVWECIENANPAWLGTQINTEISEDEKGCKVVFKHTGFEDKWAGHDAFEMTKGGWDHFVGSLVSFCEKGEGQPW
ncbi:SRPBCC family protein [Spongiimicrobium sp. 3-5]|uniref:SRPBCC family protein n=1 Tax=Spongiimicrobium sp. 3-5 TaxID=3332596 RepID=UPI0039809304